MIPVPKGCFRIQYLIHTYMDFRFLVAMAAVALSVFSSCTKDPLMMNGGGSSEGEAADFDDSAEIVPGFDGDTMVVVPNPVGEALTVYVPHVASMEGTATIYDAAARKVLETTITVDAEGKGTLQVGGLSPGAYSLSVEVGGKSSKVSFMKR